MQPHLKHRTSLRVLFTALILNPRQNGSFIYSLSGGPSHIDMYDYHPEMRDFHGKELPDSIRNGQRITGMTSKQSSFPCVAPMFEFYQAWTKWILV